MATITVTTAADVVASDGLRSLREAVTQANATSAADTIVFAPSLEGRTLTLTGGELVLRQDVTIDGDQNNDGREVTLSGGDHSRVLHVTGDGTDAQLQDLTLTHGRAFDGGAIASESANLTLTHATVTGNNATYGGGGIDANAVTLINSTVGGNSVAHDPSYNGGRGGGILCSTVTLLNSTVSDNSLVGASSGGGGGGIFGDVTLTNSVVSGNNVEGYHASGGGIFGYTYGTVILTNSTVSGNTASDGYTGGISAGTVTLINSTVSGNSADVNGGIHGHYVTLTNSRVSDNIAAGDLTSFGGGIDGGYVSLINSSVSGNSAEIGGGIFGSSVIVTNSTISNNTAEFRSGGIEGQHVTLTNSTISGNSAKDNSGGINGEYVTLIHSTITGNSARYAGGGVYSSIASTNNSIVAGNSAAGSHPDLDSATVISNGHNIFGSDVTSAIIGDLQGISPSLLFAAIDPATGGGQVDAAGAIPLRNSVTDPALSGGDPLALLPTDQLGHIRPEPAGSLPDIGAAERNQTLSTRASPNNDVLTGTDAANTILGHAGADLIRGLGGNDTLRGEDGSDVLDGGPGNDRLDGGDGINLARFGGSTGVTVDLVAGTATRGTETDTLIGIQGAIGSSAADTFLGDGGPNWFQGGGGRDVATGDAGRDLYDYDRTSDSLPGSANRDVITDFAHGSDKIDLSGIDANATIAGNQSFTWLADAPLTGAGQLNFVVSGGNIIVQASTDADAAPELQIRLTGIVTLDQGDFLL